jgi:hypothetical protein
MVRFPRNGLKAPTGIAAAAALLLSGSLHSRGPTDWIDRIESMPSPAGASSAQPQLTVAGDRAILSWIERGGTQATLKFAERTPTGWSAPRAVASGTDWFVNWADVPSVTRLDDRTLAAHWLQKSGSDTYAYDVRLSMSKDGGRTWSPSTTPHQDGTKTEHGFASLFQAPGAGLGLVWLDGRAMRPGGHEGHGGGDMSLRGAIFDRAGKQMSEALVDDRVCECCPTAAAATSEGIIVAFRNRTSDEVRDIYVSRLVHGSWTEPAAVHNDGWRIPACPVNGPALSARGSNVALAWFTVQDGDGHAFAAFSRDAGRTFGRPVRIDDAVSLGRVDVELVSDEVAAVSWIEAAAAPARFRVRRVAAGGDRSAAVDVAAIPATRSSGYPRMARRGNELLFAWTEPRDGNPQIRTAAAQLVK